MPDKTRPLNVRQLKFCDEYIICEFDAGAAAENAGYSKKTAYSMGPRLLKDERIKERISDLINESLGTNRDQLRYKVIKEMASIAFADVTEDIQIVTEKSSVNVIVDGIKHKKEIEIQVVKIADTKKMKHKAAISSIKQTDKGIEIKYHSKDRTLENLGRYGGLFTDKLEIESTGPEVHIYLPDNGRDDN